MRIEYVEGDLVKSDEAVIIHGCNAKGKFAKGFAEVIRKVHPAAYDAYAKFHKADGLVLGSVIWAYDGRLIGNAITQPTYGNQGQHVSYAALEAAFAAVDDAAVNGVPGTPFDTGFSQVSMPLIGSALGGGDWREIEAIIQRTLVHARPIVYVLPGNKPSAAELSSKPSR